MRRKYGAKEKANPVLRCSCKQDAKDADLPTGVYIDVHEQGKTQIRQSIAPQIRRKRRNDLL